MSNFFKISVLIFVLAFSVTSCRDTTKAEDSLKTEENAEVKVKDDKVKIKTDDKKVKIKVDEDGEVKKKVKTNNE